jgi:hypothetical protein
MSNKQIKNDELTMDVVLVPSLDAAAQTWYEAMHRFQMEPLGENRDTYCKATFELGLRFTEWSTQLSEFFEQLRLWFDSHPEDSSAA